MKRIKNETWRAIGRDILFADTLICTVNVEDGVGKFNRALERAALIAAAPETARKLAEAEARIAELVAVLHGCNEWFTLHHSAANIRKPGGKPTPALITIRDAIAHAESQQPRTT